MRVCLYEDGAVAGLEPVALTRPAFDLICGLSALGGKQRRHFAAAEVGALVRPHLAGVARLSRPGVPVNDPAWLADGPALLVNGRWLPPGGHPVAAPASPTVGLVNGEVAWVAVGADELAGLAPAALDDHIAQWRRRLPTVEAGGMLIRHLWELVERNGEQIARDYAGLRPRHAGFRPPGVAHEGPRHLLLIDPSARIDPLVMVDTTGGPVVVARDAVVTAFSRLEGPCYVGVGTHVLGAKVRAGTTLGPSCRVGGEVEASIVQGYTNKYHDGFLGHSYVGEWVNFGAGTHTSDLRLDYGPVTVTVDGRRVPTGRAKVGSFLGDHVKTGLGALLNAGTAAGPFAHLLPAAGLLPRWVPAFSRTVDGRLGEQPDLDGLLTTAGTVMGRRGIALSAAHAAAYRAVHAQTAPARRQAERDAEQRRLRKSA
jgi:UDP-N-acetylglucosamine diphosphorylase/glucosamine-1-phosphate N-acetyltransferase